MSRDTTKRLYAGFLYVVGFDTIKGRCRYTFLYSWNVQSLESSDRKRLLDAEVIKLFRFLSAQVLEVFSNEKSPVSKRSGHVTFPAL